MNSAIILIAIVCIASIVAAVIALKSEQKNTALKSYAQQLTQLQEQVKNLKSLVSTMDYHRQLEIVKIERLIYCTGMSECIEKLNQQEDEEISKIINKRKRVVN